MVNKQSIEKAINLVVKHGSFHRNLVLELPNITDNEDEYHLIKDAIWEWQEKYHDSETEHLKVVNSIGQEAEMEGDGESSWFTDEMLRIAQAYRPIYTIHNHPNTGAMFSGADIYCLSSHNEKYSMALGEDGVMIIKNNITKMDDKSQRKMEFISDFADNVITQWVKKDYANQIKKYEDKLLDESLSVDELKSISEETTKFLNSKIPSTLRKHDKELANALQTMFDGQKLPCEVYFIPKKKMKR